VIIHTGTIGGWRLGSRRMPADCRVVSDRNVKRTRAVVREGSYVPAWAQAGHSTRAARRAAI
jgi:hypothetical protein